MADNDFSIDVDFNGKSVVVEFFIQQVAADWWLTVISAPDKPKKKGSTTDDKPDIVAFNPKTLDAATKLEWVVLLFGPPADMDVEVTVDVRQGAKVLGQKRQTVSLKAKKGQQLTGVISLGAQ